MQDKRWLPDMESRSSGGNGGTELNFVSILTVAFACVDQVPAFPIPLITEWIPVPPWCLITGIPASFLHSLSL